jgi:hypothetical protein
VPSPKGFLDVAKAVSFLSSRAPAIRGLVMRKAIPYHRAPSGRLLFDRRELESWVRGGRNAGHRYPEGSTDRACDRPCMC